MKVTTILEGLDPELMNQVVSRRGAVGRSGKMAGALALASMPVAFGLMAKSVFAQGGLPQAIIDVLNFALTLEFLEDDFYQMGIAAPGLIPGGDLPIFLQISKHETKHVALLQSVLGANAVDKPTFDFTAGGAFDPFNVYAQFQILSQGFEDTGVRAYKGQAPALMGDNTILTTALRIHSVEARHASEVRRLRGQKGWITGNTTDPDAAPIAAVYAGEENTAQATVNTVPFGTADSASEAFDEPLSMDQVNAIAGMFIA
jgi:Ferritin-like domain